MNAQSSPPEPLVFGPFTYEPGTGGLFKHRTRLKLQGQPLKILGILLERHGVLVSRLELQKQLWPDATSGDFEHGLNAAVNKLRQTLGDAADQPRYIETITGRGYRFTAPLGTRDSRAPLEMPAVAPAVAPRRHAWGWIAAAVLLAAMAGATGAWLWGGRQKAAIEPAQFVVQAPPGFAIEGAGTRQAFALSPDGKFLAFSAMNAGGGYEIFLRDLSRLEVRPVPDSGGAQTLFWSADGASLYFTARGQLRRAAWNAPASVLVTHVSSAVNMGLGLADGRLMISGRLESSLIPANSSTATALPQAYPWPAVLPGGKRLLYTVFDSQAWTHRVYAGTLGLSGDRQEILAADSRAIYTDSVNGGAGYLLYIKSGVLMAQRFDASALKKIGEAQALVRNVTWFMKAGSADFSLSKHGVLAYQRHVSRSQLIWVDRQGNKISAATPAELSSKSASLSPDGRKIATSIYDIERGVSDIWIYDVSSGGGRRVIAGRGLRAGGIWSADSKRLAFMAADAGWPKLGIREVADGGREELWPDGDFTMVTSWSKDGRYLLLNNYGNNDQASDVMLVDLSGGREMNRLIKTEADESNAVFSPDAKWVAFTSNDSGKAEVYIQGFNAGSPAQMIGDRHLVSRGGARCVRWRQDGREVYYLGGDGKVYAVSVKTSPALEIGKAQALFTISTEARGAIHSVTSFDVSRDGKRFLIPDVSSADAPAIVVVQNWEAAFMR